MFESRVLPPEIIHDYRFATEFRRFSRSGECPAPIQPTQPHSTTPTHRRGPAIDQQCFIRLRMLAQGSGMYEASIYHLISEHA